MLDRIADWMIDNPRATAAIVYSTLAIAVLLVAYSRK